MDRHRILFKYDGTQDDESIVMAFAKKAVDQRKEWLTSHMEECKRRKELGLQEQYLYTKTTKAVTYAEFINLELVLFSNADNVRSIPSVVCRVHEFHLNINQLIVNYLFRLTV